jgi:hypothetical protein
VFAAIKNIARTMIDPTRYENLMMDLRLNTINANDGKLSNFFAKSIHKFYEVL